MDPLKELVIVRNKPADDIGPLPQEHVGEPQTFQRGIRITVAIGIAIGSALSSDHQHERIETCRAVGLGEGVARPAEVVVQSHMAASPSVCSSGVPAGPVALVIAPF